MQSKSKRCKHLSSDSVPDEQKAAIELCDETNPEWCNFCSMNFIKPDDKQLNDRAFEDVEIYIDK